MTKWIELFKNNDYLGVKKYIADGGNVNLSEENGESVICFAMRHGVDSDIIELLVDSGAELKHCDNEGVSVFDVAITYNNIDLIKKLLDDGCDINAPTRRSGFTPLMCAVCYNRVEIIELFLQKGADVTATDSQGFSALDFARKMHKKSILALLESYSR